MAMNVKKRNLISNKYKGIVLFCILIITASIIFFYVPNHWVASLSLLALLSCFFIYYQVRRKKRNQINRLSGIYKKCTATIISIKDVRPNTLVLQLLISEAEKNYISSFVIKHADNVQYYKYVKDAKIEVFIDPQNKHHIVIPAFNEKSNLWFKRNRKTMLIIFSFIAFGSIPFMCDLSDNSERLFQDWVYIKNSDNRWNLWELRFEYPSWIYISVYDSLAGKEEFSLVEQKEKKLDESTNFQLFQRGHSVFILGTGDTPVLDEYDDQTFRKISDIKSFESKNSFLNRGIARIEKHSVLSEFLKEKVFMLTTNDGNICYYNFNQNIFFSTKEEVKDYFKKANSALMGKHMNTFFLSTISDSTDEIRQLVHIRAKGSKGLNDLMEVAGNENERLGYYLSPYFKHLTIDTIAKETYFYNAKITYFDFDVVVVQSNRSLAKDSHMQIDGYDKDGNSLFHINAEDFPFNKMTSSYKQRYYGDIRRNENLLIIMVKFYGAICIDIKTRKIIWKYEYNTNMNITIQSFYHELCN
jgi:general stress protein CsbA